MICVDKNRGWLKSSKWRHNSVCHMFSDIHDLEELHSFAERMGLKRCWFQNHQNLPHYDLTPAKRTQALVLGAKEVSDKEMVACYRHPKRSAA